MLRSSENTAKWLAVIRIYAGAFWLIHAWPKWTTAMFMPPNGFIGPAVAKMTAESSGFYHTFLGGVVAPNIDLFAHLIRTGELLVAISLLLGLFTRAGAIGGMFLALNYLLAHSELSGINGYASLDAAAFVLSFINLVLPAGAICSLDAVLARRRRRRA